MPLMTRPAAIQSASSRPRRPAYQAASPAQKLSESASSQMTSTRIASVSATFASWRTSRTASGGTASRRNRDQLEARRDEPLFHRRPSADRYQLDESVREDVRRADRDNRTDDDESGVERFQGRPAVVNDQQTDQGDRRRDDAADDLRPGRQVERVVTHSGEPTLRVRLRRRRSLTWRRLRRTGHLGWPCLVAAHAQHGDDCDHQEAERGHPWGEDREHDHADAEARGSASTPRRTP